MLKGDDDGIYSIGHNKVHVKNKGVKFQEHADDQGKNDDTDI